MSNESTLTKKRNLKMKKMILLGHSKVQLQETYSYNMLEKNLVKEYWGHPDAKSIRKGQRSKGNIVDIVSWIA